MRFLFRLVFSIFRLIFRLVYSVVVFCVILLGILYLIRPAESEAWWNSIQQNAQQVYQYVSGQDENLNLGQDVKTLTEKLSDNHVEQSSGARWNQASATVYIETQDATFRRAYLDAMESWNQTGAFQFQIVEDASAANIIATEMNDGQITAAGEANSQTNLLTNRFVNVTVRLNRYYLLDRRFGYSYERIVHTAEHELGHAIGLDHNEGHSVMQSAGSFYGIQEVDVEQVRQLYAS